MDFLEAELAKVSCELTWCLSVPCCFLSTCCIGMAHLCNNPLMHPLQDEHSSLMQRQRTAEGPHTCSALATL